jgi:hypothetical protein
MCYRGTGPNVREGSVAIRRDKPSLTVGLMPARKCRNTLKEHRAEGKSTKIVLRNERAAGYLYKGADRYFDFE